MTKQPYEVTVASIEEVHTLPGIWPDAELRRLLEMAEADDIGQIEESELLDMVVMALQDLGHQAAGELVLASVFGDAMRPGVRQNLVDDLQADEPWEEYPNVAQQRGLFVAVVLLEKAFPNRFGVPDALRIRLDLRALSEAGAPRVRQPDAAFLVRLLAQGMADTEVLNRLYEEDLGAGPFPDATGMIWHLEIEGSDGAAERACQVRLSGPRMWFESLRKGQVIRASA